MNRRGPDSLSPLDIRFRRQAVRRLVFDQGNAIPLSMLKPAESIDLGIEHPAIGVSGGATDYQVEQGTLTVSAQDHSESALWIGGFNPFATYDVQFKSA